jgi:hypothetical protein
MTLAIYPNIIGDEKRNGLFQLEQASQDKENENKETQLQREQDD